MATSDPITEPDHPWPPRYWWTKRITAWSCIVLVLTGIAWTKWWHDARTALAARVTAIRERHEPMYPADFVIEPVPDDVNAAEYLLAAEKVLSRTAWSPLNSNTDFSDYYPYVQRAPGWMAMTKSAITGNAQAMQLVRQARQYRKVNWHMSFSSPMFSVLLPSLNGPRALASHMADAAIYHHALGDDAEAIEDLKDINAMADAVSVGQTLVSQLVAVAMDSLALERLQVMSPDLRIAGDPNPAPTTQPVNPASRQTIQGIIQRLMDRAGQSRMRKGFIAERGYEFDSIAWMTSRSTLLSPMFKLDTLNTLDVMDQHIAAVSQPSMPHLSPSPSFNPDVVYVNMMTMSVSGSMSRAEEVDFQTRTESGLVAVVLAARLYQIDHGGAWPGDLQALVPEYLPKVPVDPFSRGGDALQYILLDNARRPIIYSVGLDGHDHTKDGMAIPSTPMIGWQGTSAKQSLIDQWRDISHVETPLPTTLPRTD